MNRTPGSLMPRLMPFAQSNSKGKPWEADNEI